jgi:hypothetical protein
MSEVNINDLATMLYDVCEQKRDYILSSECGAKENSQATEDFIKCANVIRDLQKDADETDLEQQRIDNERDSNARTDAQKEKFDMLRLGIEGAGVILTGVGLVMSFVKLKEFQEINLESVITNKDAVRSAEGLFDFLFKKTS